MVNIQIEPFHIPGIETMGIQRRQLIDGVGEIVTDLLNNNPLWPRDTGRSGSDFYTEPRRDARGNWGVGIRNQQDYAVYVELGVDRGNPRVAPGREGPAQEWLDRHIPTDIANQVFLDTRQLWESRVLGGLPISRGGLPRAGRAARRRG